MRLSVAILAGNEEENLGRCLEAVRQLADEIIIGVDDKTTDNTAAIAKKYTKNVFILKHEDNFHINKKKVIDKCTGDWILQLDADEVITQKLAGEIKRLLTLSDYEIEKEQSETPELFLRHKLVVELRDGKIGEDLGPYTAFFVPRVNFFLGSYLTRGGVYPDGVIRLFKKGFAQIPAGSVHEQIEIKGRVGWLRNNLQHYGDPTFWHYINRFNRYTDLEAKSVTGGVIGNFLVKPLIDRQQGFLTIYFRHLGFMDGFPGFIWALFSALHFPVAYLKCLESKVNR